MENTQIKVKTRKLWICKGTPQEEVIKEELTVRSN